MNAGHVLDLLAGIHAERAQLSAVPDSMVPAALANMEMTCAELDGLWLEAGEEGNADLQDDIGRELSACDAVRAGLAVRHEAALGYRRRVRRPRSPRPRRLIERRRGTSRDRGRSPRRRSRAGPCRDPADDDPAAPRRRACLGARRHGWWTQ